MVHGPSKVPYVPSTTMQIQIADFEIIQKILSAKNGGNFCLFTDVCLLDVTVGHYRISNCSLPRENSCMVLYFPMHLHFYFYEPPNKTMSKRSSQTSLSSIKNDDGETALGAKKAKQVDQELMSFDDLLPKLEGISKTHIISCLAHAWKSSSGAGGPGDMNMKLLLKQAIEKASDNEKVRVQSEWCGVDTSPSMILDYNWKQVDGKNKMNIKDEVGKAAETIELTGEGIDCTWPMDDFVRMCKEDDEIIFDDEDEDSAWGCEECGVPGSTLALRMETRIVSGCSHYRLVTESDVKCACMSHYGSPESVAGGEEIYYPRV
jgi:hypothetical protein